MIRVKNYENSEKRNDSIFNLIYMRTIISGFILVLLCGACSQKAPDNSPANDKKVPPIDRSLALTPPMGWNSWDCLGWGATEYEVKACADYMAKNLKHLGYEYIVIDQGWFADEKAINFEDFVHERMTTKPQYNLDKYGRICPDTIRFPSARGGKGFKPLVDYIHSLGLKFGFHILRGIPWEAAEKNVIIEGTQIKAGTIAQPDKGCEWYDGYYGIDMTKPGAQEYYNSEFRLFAEWGTDFIKADDVVNLEELEGISKASRFSGGKIVLSVVAGGSTLEQQKENAHMARLSADFWDVWEMLKRGIQTAAHNTNKSEPGFWPDLDMLPVGKLGLKHSLKGPDARISHFNKDELHTLMTLFYIFKSPLLLGGYLPETDQTTYDIITNEEALDVNKNGINGHQIKIKNAISIWTADVQNSEDKYLAFFNIWESAEPIDIKVTFAQLGLKGEEYKVRDLWAKKDLGSFKGQFSAPINAHGAGLFKISK
jgi:alpha-galactosidase